MSTGPCTAGTSCALPTQRRQSWRSGIRVEAEDLRTGKKTHANSCYFTMVALDGDGGPVAVPGLVLETDADRRRCEEATRRAAERQRPKN